MTVWDAVCKGERIGFGKYCFKVQVKVIILNFSPVSPRDKFDQILHSRTRKDDRRTRTREHIYDHRRNYAVTVVLIVTAVTKTCAVVNASIITTNNKGEENKERGSVEEIAIVLACIEP